MFANYDSDGLIKIRLVGVGTVFEMENTSKGDWIDVIFIW